MAKGKRPTSLSEPTKRRLLIAAGVAAVGLISLSVYAANQPANRIAEQWLRPEARVSTTQVEAERTTPETVPQPVRQKITVLLTLDEIEPNRFRLSEEVVPEGEDPRIFAVNRFLSSTEMLPISARALSIELDEIGNAELTFSPEFGRMSFGSMQEALIVNGILGNLGQFEEVKTVLFYSDGLLVASFGHLDLSQPMQVLTVDAKGAVSTPEPEPGIQAPVP
ncbi:MAG: GerMN domain-containing protein [Fimbriimonadaceae bacterium]